MLLPWLASHIGRALFLPEPASVLDDAQKAAFDQIFCAMDDGHERRPL